jgi:hypothetical protein
MRSPFLRDVVNYLTFMAALCFLWAYFGQEPLATVVLLFAGVVQSCTRLHEGVKNSLTVTVRSVFWAGTQKWDTFFGSLISVFLGFCLHKAHLDSLLKAWVVLSILYPFLFFVAAKKDLAYMARLQALVLVSMEANKKYWPNQILPEESNRSGVELVLKRLVEKEVIWVSGDRYMKYAGHGTLSPKTYFTGSFC